MDDQHVEHYHHSEPPLVSVTLERGMKGTYGWTATVSAPTVAEALRLLAEAEQAYLVRALADIVGLRRLAHPKSA